MIAQTMIEYGAVQSVAAAFAQAYYAFDNFVGRGNTKYLLLGALAVVVFLLLTRRRTV